MARCTPRQNMQIPVAQNRDIAVSKIRFRNTLIYIRRCARARKKISRFATCAILMWMQRFLNNSKDLSKEYFFT